MILQGQRYIVPLQVTFTELNLAFESLELGITNIKREFQTLNKTLKLHHHKAKEILEPNHVAEIVSSNMANQINTLLSGVHDRKRDLERFIESMHEPKMGIGRNKRALMGVGGQALKFAFGLATESDVQDNQNRIEVLADLYTKAAHGLNVHSSIINSSIAQIIQLDNKQVMLESMMQNVQEQLRKLTYTASLSLQDIAHVSILTSSLTNLNTGFLDLYLACQTFKQGISDMNAGRVSTTLIPPEQILKLVNQIIAGGQEALFPAHEKFVPIYYELIKVHRTKQTMKYFLSIPIGSLAHHHFILYKVVAHPIFVRDNLILQTDKLPHYFAINKDQSLKIELTSLDHCEQTGDLFLCPNQYPILKSTKGSCLAQLFLNTHSLEACERSLTLMPTTEQFTKLPRGWFYLSPHNVTITVSCPKKEIIHQTLAVGSGEFAIPLHCQISSNNYLIAATTDFSGTPINATPEIKPFRMNIKQLGNFIKEALDQDKIQKILINHNNQSIPLKLLQEKLTTINLDESEQNLHYHVIWTSLGVGSLGSVGVIIMGVSLCALLLKCKATNGRHLIARSAKQG